MPSQPTDLEQWSLARDRFLDLAEMPPAERAAALVRLELELPELAPVVARLLEQDPGPETPPPPRNFGPYVEIRPLGRGGMGEVFLARRADGIFEREVAVKLLRRNTGGRELIERFHRERRTLAALEHESIVRVLDGGTTEDGQPFLVMDYVEGRPLDEYIREADLTLRQRLGLFLRITNAVAFAHNKGIIHRDIKPANLLVREDGEPRLVDFGISLDSSKANARERALTQTGHRLFTLEYASPEQILGAKITPASDVFALGVLLYELIAEASPWPAEGSFQELEKHITEGLIVPPSRKWTGTRRRSLRGDLDTIVLKCLDQDPARRYENAGELADDMERHLAGLGIRARRLGIHGRGVRYLRRHPWRTAALSAGVVTSVLVGVLYLGSRQDAQRAREIEARADERLKGVMALTQRGMVQDAGLELAAIVADLEELDVDEVLRADLWLTEAWVALLTGDLKRAEERLTLCRTTLRPDEPEHASRLVRTGTIETNFLGGQGRFEEAIEVARGAVALALKELEPLDSTRITAQSLLSRSLLAARRVAEAVPVLEQALADVQTSGIEYDRVAAEIEGNLGRAYLEVGRVDEAIPLLEKACDTLQFHFGTGHKDVAEMMTFQAIAIHSSGNSRAALKIFRKVRAAYRTLDQLQSRAFALERMAEAAAAAGEAELAIEVNAELTTEVVEKMRTLAQ